MLQRCWMEPVRLTFGRSMWLIEQGRLRRVVARVGQLRLLLVVRIRVGCIIGVHGRRVGGDDCSCLESGKGQTLTA